MVAADEHLSFDRVGKAMRQVEAEGEGFFRVVLVDVHRYAGEIRGEVELPVGIAAGERRIGARPGGQAQAPARRTSYPPPSAARSS